MNAIERFKSGKVATPEELEADKREAEAMAARFAAFRRSPSNRRGPYA